MRFPLQGGDYQARSRIAAFQRCINLYPEVNPQGNLSPVTYYQRPGLVPLVQGPVAPVRGIFQSSQMVGYCVIGQGFFKINRDFSLKLLVQLATPSNNICSFVDNGVTGLLVDGTPGGGYQLNLATDACTPVVDPTGTFVGSTRVDIIDGFIVGNILGTPSWFSTLNQSLTFDGLYVASKNNYPDQLQTMIVNRHQISLIGTLTEEWWYNAGNPNFPFAENPGTSVPHGTVAKYSLAWQDNIIFYLSQDPQGQGVVLAIINYQAVRISNYGLEEQIRKMAKTVGIADAIGYCYQQDGHTFYVLIFPAGDQTWVCDTGMISDPNMAWHQRSWTDAEGVGHRDRSNCAQIVYGRVLAGDWQNGTIYEMDLDVYTDNVEGVVAPFLCIRGFPHFGEGSSGGQLVASEFKRMQMTKFILDMEVGGGAEVNGLPAQIGLTWSIDRGKTFGNTILQSNGEPGGFETSPRWGPLGMSRDPLFEIAYAINGPAALNGAFIDTIVLDN